MRTFRLFLILVIVSACHTQSGKDVQIGDNIIYEDILDQLVLKSEMLPINGPPEVVLPPTSATKEARELQRQIYELEDRLNKIQDFLLSDNKLFILDKLLPMQEVKFKKPNSCSFSGSYDTTWIGNIDNRINNGFLPRNIKSLNIQIPNFKISLIPSIPDPDTTIYHNKNIDLFKQLYLQLSEIILDSSRTKGIFYYAISTRGNLNGMMAYCYIRKINNNWEIVDK